MTQSGAAIPAGWYADPAVPGQLRYWDGSAWTGHTSPAGYTPNPAASQTQPVPYPWLKQRSTNGMAIVSLVLALHWLCGIGSALAILFGIKALGEIDANGDNGRALATAGIVIGIIGVVGTFVWLGLIYADLMSTS